MLGLEEMFGEESSFTALTDSEKRYFVEIIREEMRVREGMGKCEQVREVVPIELWINSPFFIGPDVHSIYPYWKDLICDIFSNKRDNQNKINQVILSGCFTGDTKVRLADGTSWSMKELYDKYHTDVPLSDYFYVYSWGKGFHSYDEMIPAMAYNIHITKRVNKLAKITFSTGDIVKCTTDHLFLLIDGSYIQAKRLIPDSQLRSAIKLGYQDIRVRSVEIIEADELVYDFEVKTHHNFLLSCGVFVHNSIGTGKSCLNSNTRVSTSLGLLKLKDLKMRFDSGERFFVRSESGIRQCLGVYDNGEAFTKILKFRSGRVVEGTFNHKFRVIRDGKIQWVQFEDIRVGDKTLMLRDSYQFGRLHMNLDEAYTLGYMVGDGWCEKVKGKDKYSSFQVMFQFEHKKSAKRIIRAFYNWFGIRGVEFSRSGKLKNGNHMIYLRAFDSERATKLVKSGFGHRAQGKGIPNFIFMCDRETVASFIQGLFDADGTVEKDGYTYIGLMSERGIKDLGRLLSLYGIDYTIKSKMSRFEGKDMGQFWKLSIRGTESYIRFADLIGFSIESKMERLNRKVKKCKLDKNPNDRILVPFGCEILRELDRKCSLGNFSRIHTFIQFRVQSNYTLRQLKRLYNMFPEWVGQSDYLKYICEHEVYFDEVSEIDKGFCHTMDLEIEGDHSYCFDGFVSHNTCSELIMLRKLYELSCFRNVNSMFHLMSKTNIMLFFFSINKTQAESTAFGEFRSLVDHSPYFNQHFKRRQRLDSLLVFPEGITVAFGSRSSDSTGMTVISALLDEANFIGGDGSNKTGNTDKALEMYAGMVNRANSRFIVDGGLNHSLNILVSSSTHESSATERQIAISRDDPHTVIAAPSQWEVKPDKFSKEYFYVLKGTNYLEPQIINSVDDVNNFRLSEGLPITKYIDGDDSLQKIEEEIEKLPPHQQAKFLRVPIDLRRGFEMNIVRSLQDLGGVSTGTTGKLFNSPAVFDDCIDPKLRHPFISQEIIVSTGDQLEIKNYLRNDFRLVHPERPRYIHIDQSTRTDSTGISCVYASDILDTGDGVKKPVFSVDFMLRINPPKPPKKIAIYKIRNFVIFLSRYMGMKIGRVTYDIFNSEESRQILEEMGFNVGYQSVDRSDKAYLDLVEIMYEGRLRIYDYPILRHELFNLIHYRDKRKVDHPATVKDSTYSGKGASVGSKDVSDSLCLTGDTEIILASGGYIRIDRLAQRNPDEFFVVSRDMRGLLVPGRARKARMTKKTKDIIEVRLSNNTSFRCTPDHKIMLADGTYKEAKDLVPESDKLATSSMLRGLAIYPISVISISLKDEIPVYDISVDGYHNFELACGVFVHNCGAVENALQIPIAVETGTNSTLKDFLAANQFRGGFEPDPMSIEELVDKQIDDMIEEMEFGRSGLGSFGGLRGF